MRMCFNSGMSYNYSARSNSTVASSARSAYHLPRSTRPLIGQNIIAAFIGPRKPCGSCGGSR